MHYSFDFAQQVHYPSFLLQQKYFHNLKGNGYNIQSLLFTALEVMKIFLLFYMCHFAMGLTHCHKTAVFLTLIFAVFLLNLIYSFRQTLPAISAA